jgi:type I restriction enzyme S subunit
LFIGALIMNNEREFKDLPEGWKFSKVKDLFVDGRGRIISEEEIKNKEGIYPVYSSQTSNNGELGKINTYDFEGEFITWTTDGANAGTVFYRNGKFNCTNVCGILKPRNENINVKFFSYLLSTIAKNYVSYIGNPKLMNSTFRDIKIIHPNNYYEQQKIAEILETVDNAIEKTDKIIEKYKRIKQGLMQDLLTKGIDENGNIRDEKTHKFKDSPLGKIPEEWEVVRLGEVSDINPERIKYEQGRIIKYIDIESINDGNVSDYKIFKIEEAPSRAQRIVKEHDILISTVRPNLKAFTIIKPEYNYFVCSTGFAVVRSKSSINPLFLFHVIWFDEIFLKQVLPLVVGSSYPAVNSNELINVLIPLPPLPEQQRIAEILLQIDQTIEKEEQYKEKLQKIKQGLMEDLLTGKVRVNNLIKEA